ncbi:MAG: DUF3105 domain-containing protein [Alphaproteobacteria bacterium]
MAKSKSRKKSKSKSKSAPQHTEPENKGKVKPSVIKIAVAAALAGAAGWWWFGSQQAESRFFDHVQSGVGTLDHVVRHADHGTSGHLSPGESINYGTNTPTSGRHGSRPVSPGVYETAQSPTMLVHSLEHGMVVIYYDSLSADAMATLNEWSGLYGADFSGIVLTRQPGLDDKLVLTAWHKSLTLDGFDAPAAAVFIDAYRGRGPENPVR